MAASKTYFSRSNYNFLPNNEHKNTMRPTTDTLMEFDESDIIWNNNTTSSNTQIKQNLSRNFSSPARRERTTTTGGAPASLPVNVPDWSKILKEEYTGNNLRNNNNKCCDDDDDEDGVDCFGKRIPPHEFLARQMARTRIVSFSVHEGVGRTLKGRDLSRVRNAIWEKTGFQD
ncbi:hypothetical protein LIER_42921 [Lithospermum erythrorhizon]|uniref:Senescence regulator n=1 Tax=Lithospermum erythrorhizon TaxID=34254 RepID=A0AAV3P8Y8_LITER